MVEIVQRDFGLWYGLVEVTDPTAHPCVLGARLPCGPFATRKDAERARCLIPTEEFDALLAKGQAALEFRRLDGLAKRAGGIARRFSAFRHSFTPLRDRRLRRLWAMHSVAAVLASEAELALAKAGGKQ